MIDQVKENISSLIICIYACIFMIFVSTLFFFHIGLIKDFKTTQEKLKKDKGDADNKHKLSPYSYPTCCMNYKRTLCCRRRKSQSKLTWELYLFSNGLGDQLREYWDSRIARLK